MTTYTRTEQNKDRESWQLRKRKALQRYLAERQTKTFCRNPERDLLTLFQEYLQNEQAA